MPRLRYATSDFGKIINLKKILVTGAQDIANGNPLVQQATLDEITAFLPDYESDYSIVDLKLNARMKAVRESNASMEILKMHILDIWEGVRRRNKRMALPAEVLNFYGLPLDGTNPKFPTREKWIQMGNEVVTGDTSAVAAGYPAILNPSIVELQTAIDKAQSDLNEVSAADRAYDLAQAAVAEHRPQADEFINEIYDQLMFALRKMDNPSQRRVIRTYGYNYEYSPDEPPEEVPAAPVLTVDFVRPHMTVSCDAVDTATGYQFVYSEDDVNWTELYVGEDNTYTYQPPVGRRVYKVRAENEYGYGDWSEEVEFTVDEVPA